MSKQRMVTGYNLKMDGIIAPGEPIKCTVNLPATAEKVCMRIDPSGNFVIFAMVWSHPEGTKVNFDEHDILIMPSNKPMPAGRWDYFETLSAGPAIFHIFFKGTPKLEIAS